jgi:hypothetical protein
MSSYAKITKHPTTGEYHLARWIDDYFAPHYYGVKFPTDEKVYPVDLVEARQVDNFWKNDVIAAFQYVSGFGGNDDAVITFLNQIEKEYKARWKRDPFRGEGAYLPCEHVVRGGECIYCNLVIEEE